MAKDVKVIVVPDDDAEANKLGISPGILAMLGPNTVLNSNDSLRMYVRKSHWDAMKDGHELTKR